MKYNFTSVADRKDLTAVKTSCSMVSSSLGLNYYEDSIPMWIADMDFVAAPEVVAALKRRAEMAIFGYSEFSDKYYDSVISWFAHRHNMNFTSSDIVYSPGTVTAIRNVIRAFTVKGEGVIIQPPVYYPFKREIVDNNRKLVENHLLVDENNIYSIDFEDFEKRCADPNNKMFIFCNPHNPVGQIWSAEQVQRLVDICRANDVIFFSDEVHSDLVRRDAAFTSTLNMDNLDKIIVATAVNKTFNLAGLHITNLIIPNEQMRETFVSYVGEISITPFAEAATIAAYSECEEWVNEVNSVLDDNLIYLESFLKEHLPKIKFNRPAATYLAWLDFRAYGIEEQELFKICAEEAHLILESGLMFGLQGSGFARINIACPKSLLIEALNRLERVFGKR